MRVRAVIAIVCLITLTLTWNFQLLFQTATQWPKASFVDYVSAYERHFDAIRGEIDSHTLVGYALDYDVPDPPRSLEWDNAWRKYVAQYTLAPVVVDPFHERPVMVRDSITGHIRVEQVTR